MATLAAPAQDQTPAHEYRFFASLAIAMALVVIAGFSTQLALGRSTFASPLRVHFHAVAFMGWVFLFVTQSWLATRGPLALHRKLGWIGAGWVVLMVVAALNVVVAQARAGHVVFFFVPQQFIIGDPLTLFGFVGLTAAAITMRQRTDWHARLHICAMAMLMGPAFGRLLPMPLLRPWSFEIAVLLPAMFLIAGMVRDLRLSGAIHPAWWRGFAVMAAALILTDLIAYSSAGDAIYRTVTAGSPGAEVPGLEYPVPPAGPLRTGR